MAWFEHADSRIYYEESGAGVPVMLLPGWGGTIDELTPLREALSPSFRIIAADLSGSGKSGPQPRTYTSTYFWDDAPAFLALLAKLDASPAHLVGFSDGGEYSLLMAALEPDAARSVVTWGAGGRLPDAPHLAEAMVHMIDSPPPPMQGFAEYLKAAYGEAGARVMTQTFGAALGAIMKAGGDISRSRAGEIACPALLITGEHDMFAPPPLVSETASAIRGAEFIEVKGASHPIHHEQGDWLVQTITGWLAKR